MEDVEAWPPTARTARKTPNEPEACGSDPFPVQMILTDFFTNGKGSTVRRKRVFVASARR